MAKGYMDAGELVPDEVIIGVILERLRTTTPATASCSTAFPRTIEQADALAGELEKLDRRLTAALLHRGARRRRRPAALGPAGQPQDGSRLPRRVRPAQARRPLRHRRVAADPAQRRRGGDGPQAAGGLPPADGAADRLLRGRGACCGASTGRGARARSTTTSARRSRRCASRSSCRPARRPAERRRAGRRGRRAAPAVGRADARTMIIKKTPEQIEKMAAAGEILVRTLRLLERQIRPGVTTAELDATAEKFIRSQGAGAGLQGLPGLPGLDLRVAELDGRPRDPGALRARAGRRDLDRRRRDARRVGRRRGADLPGRAGRRDRVEASGDDRAVAVRGRRPVSGRQPPRRRLPRGSGCVEDGRPGGRPVARRPRDRPRHARGSADPQLRAARQGPACSSRAWSWRSSR